MPDTLLQSIQEMGLFSAIRDSAPAYPILLWLHLAALIVWGGMMLMTDLRFLGYGFSSDSVSGLIDGLRWPKRISFLIAGVCGLLLFGAKAGQYANNPWFWIKMLLLALLAANAWLLRRGHTADRLKLAGGLSLVLWMAAIGAARGPATVKDIMKSMVDPSADLLFGSVKIVSDDLGLREVQPRTDEEWKDVGARVQVLLDAPEFLSSPGRRAARPRDRAQSPQVENEPAEVQALMDADHADFELHARKLHDAASVVMQAVEAKDKDALFRSLNGVDVACERCHLRYWYPKDKRALEAAREAGILE
jgi:hypothetical protein